MPSSRRRTRTPGDAPKSAFHLSGRLSTGVPIQELVSPSHQIVSNPAVPGRADFVIADSDQTPNNRDFILRYRLAGQQIGSGLLLYQGKDENFFLLMAQPPRAVAADDVPPREYIFVLDVSGSMNGFPLNTAKQLMRDLVKVLRPSDTFNVVVFAPALQTFSPLVDSGDHVPISRRALEFIGPKNGGGGTELLAAIKRRWRFRVNQGFRAASCCSPMATSRRKRTCSTTCAIISTRPMSSRSASARSVNRYLIEGSRARRARRTVRRDRIRRGGGRGGDVPSLHRHRRC